MAKTTVKASFIAYGFKWLVLILIVGVAAGTLSALFLAALNLVTIFRDNHNWMLYLLPFAGLVIGFVYHHKGKGVERGNNLIFDTVHNPAAIIPFKMVPLVLTGTVVTHLFGGSAGREGTALQMAAATADQLHKPFKLNAAERTILLIAGLSAGFASVFGTPLAGIVFGVEVLLLGKIPVKAILPAIVTAFIGAYVTELWGVGHTHYSIAFILPLTFRGIAYSVIAGLAFGLAAIAFVKLTEAFSHAGTDGYCTCTTAKYMCRVGCGILGFCQRLKRSFIFQVFRFRQVKHRGAVPGRQATNLVFFKKQLYPFLYRQP